MAYIFSIYERYELHGPVAKKVHFRSARRRPHIVTRLSVAEPNQMNDVILQARKEKKEKKKIGRSAPTMVGRKQVPGFCDNHMDIRQLRHERKRHDIAKRQQLDRAQISTSRRCIRCKEHQRYHATITHPHCPRYWKIKPRPETAKAAWSTANPSPTTPSPAADAINANLGPAVW